MKRWKLTIVVGIVIVVVAVGAYLLLLAGPKYTESDLVGTWVNKHNPEENIVLEPDGTFELYVYEVPEYLPLTVTGVWWIKEGDTLMLEAKIEIAGFSIGETASAKIKGNETLELHDEEGKIWVKQSGVEYFQARDAATILASDIRQVIADGNPRTTEVSIPSGYTLSLENSDEVYKIRIDGIRLPEDGFNLPVKFENFTELSSGDHELYTELENGLIVVSKVG